MDVSKQVIELRRPQCRCGFIFDSCVVESLLVDSDDILASYTSTQKRRRPERIAPAQARPFSDEQGYTIRNRRAENIRRNRRLAAEVYNPGEDEVSGLSTIGRAFALQSAKLTVRDLKQRGPSSSQINEFIDGFVFPVVLNIQNLGRKSAEEFKRISKESSDVKVALEKVKQALAQVVSTAEGDARLGHHRPVIDKIIGHGFTSAKTLRSHVTDWTTQIQQAYPEDSRKQV